MHPPFCVNKQSHVTLHRHCVHTNGCEKTYGEQGGQGVADSEGGVCLFKKKAEPCDFVQTLCLHKWMRKDIWRARRPRSRRLRRWCPHYLHEKRTTADISEAVLADTRKMH